MKIQIPANQSLSKQSTKTSRAGKRMNARTSLALIALAATSISGFATGFLTSAEAQVTAPLAPPTLRLKRIDPKLLEKAPGKNLGLNAVEQSTEIQQSLQIAVTGTACDSVLSPTQCLSWLSELAADQNFQFRSVSLDNWATALNDIDTSLLRIIDRQTDSQRWHMIRGMLVQARHTVARSVFAFEAAVKDPNPKYKTSLPKGLLDLKSTAQIQRVEVVHRIAITGDRIIVDQMVVDRTSPDLMQNSLLFQTSAVEVVDDTTSLGEAIKKGLANLSEDAKNLAADVESKRTKSKLPDMKRNLGPSTDETGDETGTDGK